MARMKVPVEQWTATSSSGRRTPVTSSAWIVTRRDGRSTSSPARTRE